MFLKQSTSAVVLVGPVLDASGVAVTTAVISDFTLTKNGTSATMSGNTISHSHNGHYAITLTAANTDTIGRLTISVNNTAQAMPVFRWDVCQPTVYDALFTNAVNTTGGLPAATGAITALAGAVSTLTAAGVRTELATELGRMDATVSSRLAATSYVAPDNATIGTISINLGTVNDNVLSRLAASAYTAPPSAATNASAVRSELTTELGRIDAAISSRLATASYTAPLSAAQTRSALGLASANLDTQLADIPTVAEFEARTLTSANYANATNQTAIKSVTDKLNTGLVLDGAVYQFTVNMLENAPGGGGGGSATIENQELILANLDNVTGAVSAAVARLQLETQITGFPATICRGSDYDQTLESEIRLQLLDLENDPITEIGGTPVAEITWLFGLGTDRQPRLVAGACSWDGTTNELVIQLAATDTDTTPLGSVTWQIGAQIGELVRWLGGGTTRIVERQFTA